MGIFSKIKDALKKTSEKIAISISGDEIDAHAIESIEDSLILADVGVEITRVLMNRIVGKKFPKGTTEQDVRNFLANEIAELLRPYESDFLEENFSANPTIILVIGVNGSGKTTTIAKIANLLKKKYSPLLVAADTFRAAATEQLMYWAEKISVPIYYGKEKADPAGLVYSSIQMAQQNGNDVILIDTAGRMQNRDDLLAELEKIKRVIKKKLDESAPYKTILILDGFTGQATDHQLAVFSEKIGIDGLIITKLDGTAKGGAIIHLTQKYKVPVLALGVGESFEDLIAFKADEYAKAIMGIHE